MANTELKFERFLTLFNLFSETSHQKKAPDLKSFKNEKEIENILSNNHGFESLKIERLMDILTLERTKYNFELTNENLERNRVFEREIYYQREKLLNKEFNQLLQVQFVINPLIKLLETKWNWTNPKMHFDQRFYSQIINYNPSDNFLIFQLTGSFFENLNSSILEKPISEYQYFVLNKFANSRKLESIKVEFINEFETPSIEAMMKLEKLTILLLKELIFKTFIIPCKLNFDN